MWTAAIMCQNVCWISLGHFRTEENEQRVADAFSMSPPLLIDLRIINATDALEAWDICRDFLHRLFLLTSEFKTAWSRISSRSFTALTSLLTFVATVQCMNLGLQLFQHLSNPSITVKQVRLALSEFNVVAEDRWFVAGPPVLTSIMGTTRGAEEPSV
jgi:hypothetical protein